MDEDTIKILLTVSLLSIVVIGVTFYVLFGSSMLKPWQAEQSGKAELAQAEQNRQIAVLEAKARLESAELLANAEIAKAKGVAEANAIIGNSLKNNEAYLRYLWIEGLQDGSSEVIYIPTEANLPILEAKNN